MKLLDNRGLVVEESEAVKAAEAEKQASDFCGDKVTVKISIFNKIRSCFLFGLNKLYNLLSEKKRLLLFLGICSFILNYLLEASLRKNFVTGFTQIFNQPNIFIFNTLIIFFSFSLMLVVKRRMFYFIIGNVFWLTLIIVNTILLARRNTPFNYSDFRVLMSAFDIVGEYLSLFEQILVIGLIAFAIFLMVFTFLKDRKSYRDMKYSCTTLGWISAITIAAALLHSNYVDSSHFSNLPKAYREYGFAYSFVCSAVDHGIDKPKGYGDGLVKDVISISESIDNNGNKDVENSTKPHSGIPASVDKPNVIFIQLESFYDPENVLGVTYNKDPMPIFRRLMKENMSGWITVPSIGAGTANTEFEVLTGMDIDHFGIAEYPYLSILQNNTCESMAYNFKEYGYASHVIHNHTATFYDRNIVFPNLGFDTFISVENMGPVTRNENGWAKDSMLTGEIMDIMKYTDGQADFVYTISVQPHGKYPDTPEEFESYYNEENPASIMVYGNEEDPEKTGFDYWVNQIYDVDLFIGDLIRTLEDYDEPVMLVMFGDHLPSFSVEEWSIDEGNCFQTEYVIWTNYSFDKKESKDLYTFQLSSYIMDMLNIESGYMNLFHQTMQEDEEDYSVDSRYYNEMLILQYDMLYGEKYVYGGRPKYLPTNIRFGNRKIIIEDIMLQGDTLYVYGEGFNDRYSHIYINGTKKSTIYLKEGCVTADGVMLNDGDIIKVVQSTSDRFPLNESNHWIYNE